MTDETNLRTVAKVPDTGTKINKSEINAEIAHEGTLRYFVEHTELGVLTKEQMALMALTDSYTEMGFNMKPVETFFKSQNRYSSGEEGRGRIQVKDAITTSTLQLPWMYGDQGSGGFLSSVKDFILRRSPQDKKPQG